MSNTQLEIQNLSKQLTVGREMAILGDYDGALQEFKGIFTTVNTYSKKYDVKKGQQVNESADYYLQEKWNQFKKDLKHEYDMIVQMHKTLQLLEDNDIYKMDSFYEV